MLNPMYKLSFYVPNSHVEAVKQALFDAGAGRIGAYECCSWQTQGLGQFRPLPGSQPFIGEQGVLERLAEWKVEMVLAAHCKEAVLEALKASHPYQTPAFDLQSIECND